MKEHGILFSGPMVRAILDGRKTQTRRVVKPRPVAMLPMPTGRLWPLQAMRSMPDITRTIPCPYGAPGDRLWVRERWGLCSYLDQSYWHDGSIRDAGESVRDTWQLEYAADWGQNQEGCHWRPSIHMPRWASRITLEVTGVRVERLQDISEGDAQAEGVTRDTEPCDHKRQLCEDIGCLGPTHKASFCELWEAINGKRAPWASNPWVWVVEFRRLP